MKVAKVTFFVFLAALVAVGVSTTAYSFHSGGVAECSGCHSMHSPKAGGTFLLVGADQSSACLTCHEGPTLSSYHVSTSPSALGTGSAPVNRTPGGDFGWLKKTYSFLQRGSLVTEEGSTHGHNIIAADFGYGIGATDCTVAPGGTFSSAQLACNSCHDPHGQYRRLTTGNIAKSGAPIMASGSYNGAGNEPTANEAVGVYRLLAGAGYTKGGVTFNGVPAAKTPSSYNRSEEVTQTRTAYGVATSGGHETWSNWCATCHPKMHSTGNYVHKTDTDLGSTIATNYGTYKKSGDMTGTPTSSFTSLVPFATNTNDYAALAGLVSTTDTQLGGPATTDQVMCLSCHRAHASGFENMLRWEQEYEFITKAGVYTPTDPTTDNSLSRGRTNAEKVASYYGRPATVFATYQRVLCNKCHAKD